MQYALPAFLAEFESVSVVQQIERLELSAQNLLVVQTEPTIQHGGVNPAKIGVMLHATGFRAGEAGMGADLIGR